MRDYKWDRVGRKNTVVNRCRDRLVELKVDQYNQPIGWNGWYRRVAVIKTLANSPRRNKEKLNQYVNSHNPVDVFFK